MNKNIPPFYVGQKVKCVDASVKSTLSTPSLLNVGHVYEVIGIKRGCCSWEIAVGIKSTSFRWVCGSCGASGVVGDFRFYATRRFRAITDDFQAITYEKVLEEELVSMN